MYHGLQRKGLPDTVQAPKAAVLIDFIGEREIAQIMREADAFGIDDPCPLSPVGMHQPFASCGMVTCFHCAKVFWK